MPARRRTAAAIREVEAIHDRTADVARAIMNRVDPEGVTDINVKARPYWGIRAEYQHEVADDLVVTFSTKDPGLAERVALAIKEVL